MLINGLQVEKKNNVVIGTDLNVCNHCAAKKATEEQIHYQEAYNGLRGKFAGKRLKAFPYLKDRFSNLVYLCEDCASEIAEELKE